MPIFFSGVLEVTSIISSASATENLEATAATASFVKTFFESAKNFVSGKIHRIELSKGTES